MVCNFEILKLSMHSFLKKQSCKFYQSYVTTMLNCNRFQTIEMSGFHIYLYYSKFVFKTKNWIFSKKHIPNYYYYLFLWISNLKPRFLLNVWQQIVVEHFSLELICLQMGFPALKMTPLHLVLLARSASYIFSRPQTIGTCVG